MKKATIFMTFLDILFIFCCCFCCCDFVDADTSSCMVICEVPEEPIKYEIPKVNGKGYFYLEKERIVYQTILGD